VATFVLVHGAWHGGWCWEPLVEELAARGHAAVAPDLPCDNVDAGASACAEAVGEHPAAVVVGHSLGGLTIPLVPGRLHVFLAAFVPVPGGKLEADDALAADFGGTVRDELDRSYWPDEAAAAAYLYPDLAAATVARAFPLLRRQARTPCSERSPVEALPATVAYVTCSRDRIIRPMWQRRVARESLGVEPVELGSGHFPMLERPRALAALLEGLAGL